MNAPTRIAQVTGADGSKPTRILKIEKPQGGQAVTAEASYDGTVKIDFSAIANEKITLVHIGERLIILFDNQSTVTIIPFFDSMGVPLANITIESNGKEFTGAEFASTFPITTDQSVLPAAGEGTPASGANFSNASVDPLLAPDPLPLLGPEELPPINFTRIEGPIDNATDAVPGAGPNDPVSIDEDDIDSPFSLGNGDNAPGDDDPISVSGVLKFTAGTAPTTLSFASMDGDTVEGEDGKGISGPITSQGHDLVYVWDAGTNTLKAVWSDDPNHVVFEIEVNPTTGAYTLSLFDQLDHPYTDDPSTSADDATVTGFEDNLVVDLVYTVTDGNGDVATGTLAVDFDDDMPRVTGAVESRIVDEDDIKTPWSHGTSPNDGSGDGSITEDWSGAAFVSGTLAGLVDIGADEYPEESEGEPEGEDQPAIIGSGIIFSFAPDVVDQMEALGLYSKQSVQPATENGLPLYYTTGTSGDWQILSAFEPDTAGPGNTGNPVFELRINQVTGEYEFRLFDELIHQLPPGFPNGSDENFGLRSGEPDPVTGQAIVNGLDFGSIIRVTDYDGDSVTLDGKFLIQIRDDVPDPDIDLDRHESVIHDETPGDDGADDQSFNGLPSSARTAFTGVANTGNDPDVPSTNLGAIGFAHDDDAIVFIDFGDTELGADHPPASQVFSLTVVGGDGTDSGLDITEGNSILLFKEGDVIVGRVSGGPFDGQAAFAIHINQSGEISVAQWLSIKHDDRGDFDESNDDGFGDDASPNDTPDPIQQTLSGKINAVLTITDSDGDSESDSVGIGDRVIFQDDGPKFKKLEVAEDLTHDETPDNQGDADDIDVSGVPAAALNAFNAIVNKGDDPHVPPASGPIGYASTDGSILNVDVSYGADGQGAPIAYELVLDGNNLHSGLETTDGRDIHLFKEGNIVVGRYEVGGNNLPDGTGDEPAAFAIYIDPATGQTTMVQYVSLRHPNTGDHDEEIDIDNGLLYVKVTVVDGDGDPLTDYVDIGSKIEFQDDGPTATFTLNSGVSVIHDETVGIDGDANDVAPGSLANLFSTIGTKGNDPHDTTAPEPEIGYAQSTGPIVTVSNVNFGADGPGSSGGIRYRIDVPGVSNDNESVPSGLFTTDGRAIYLFEEDGLVVGRYEDDNFNANAPENNDPAAFAIHVDPTTGVVTVVQYVSIKHDDVNDHDEANDDGSPGNDEPAVNDAAVQQWINDSALRLTVTVTDGDGDGTSQQFNIGNKIVFQDDGLSGQNSTGVYTVSGVVVSDTLDDENQFPAFPPGSDGISGGYGDDGVGTTAVGSVNINYGVDGPATATNSLVVTGPAGVSVVVVDAEGNATTEAISYIWQPAGGGGGTLLGVSASFPAGDPAFSLTINASGSYTFNAYAPLSHPLTDDPTTTGTVETEFEDNLNLVFNYQATDGDGDFATGTITIKLDDDTPDPVCDQFEVTEGGAGSVNIVLILDRSGSMATDDVDGFDSRLALAKFAAINLLNSANVNQVMTVQFDSGAAINDEGGNFWTSKTDAINYINGLTTGSGTNYDSPLNLVQSNWGSGPTAATKTLVFFISDGEPNEPGGSAGISSGEETTWYDFLANKGVDEAYAIGIGTGVNGADANQLEPVAWHPGEASATNPTAATDNNVIVVSNSDLTDLIGALVGLLPGVVSGNVLANDGFGADGLGGITSITIDGVVYSYNELTDQITSINGTVNGSTLDVDTDIGGHLTFHFADGGGFDTGDFTYQSPTDGVPPSGLDEIFTYTIVDGDGDGQSAHLKIHVLDGNKELTISGTVTGLVEEEHGISGGIDDFTSGPPDVDADVLGNLNNTRNVQTGTFAASLVFDGDDGALSYSIADVVTGTQVLKAGGGNLTSDEQNVLFHRVDANTLVGYVEQSGAGYDAAQDRTVFTLTLNQPSAGDYTFTLHDNLDHHPDLTPDNVEGVIGINLNNRVLVTDTGELGDDELIANFTMNVIDDVPAAGAVTENLVEAGQVDTNLMLILDVSGSMNDPSGLTGLTRLDVLKASVVELLEQYDNMGDVKVRIVVFATIAAPIFTTWLSVADAKTQVLALAAGGSTNYDEALTDAMTAFSSAGKIAGAQNVSYFISDGMPNQPSGTEGINSAEEAAWEAFLVANDIVSFALGAGSGVTQAALNPIAYNGVTDTEADAIVVTDLSQLTATLVGTVNAVTATGNLLADGGPIGGFGADGGFVKSIQVVDDGVNDKTYTYDPATDVITVTGLGASTHTFNAATNVLTITTSTGATLAVDLDTGMYTYTGPASITTDFSEVFSYVLQDGDGDTAANTLTINVSNGDRPPLVRDDMVITNVSGGSASIVIPEFALLYNDTDPDGQPIFVTGSATDISDATSVARAAGNFTFTDNDSDGGKFTYTGSTANPSGSDTGNVTVNRAQAGENQLDGTGLGEILIGRDSNGDTILGYAGADVLIGYGGNDSLDGGDGNDLIVAGIGNDALVGGNGNDILIGGAGNDAVNGGAGSDVIVIEAVVGTSSDSGRVAVGGNNNDTGQDIVSGFDLTSDTLRIVAGNVSSFVHGTDTAIGTATGNVNDGTAGSFTTSTGLVELNQTTNNDWDDLGDVAVTFSGAVGTFNEANFEARLQYDLTGTSGADTITAGALDDRVNGGGGVDTLNGGGGNDILIGGLGADNVTGGAGADKFVLTDTASIDNILDYQAGDSIDLTALLNVAFGTDLVAAGYVNIVNGATDTLQIDVDGGGNNFVSVANITYSGSPGSIALTYLENGAQQNTNVTVP